MLARSTQIWTSQAAELGAGTRILVFREWDGGIRRPQLDVGLGMLKPPAGLQRFIHLLVQLVPVVDGGVHVAQVDKVKGVFLECPFLLGIVYFELEVRRDPGWLGRRYVRADDLGVGEGVGEVTAMPRHG